MKPLQNFWRLTTMITGLCLAILLVGCGSPPLIQPESDVPVAQTTAATSQPVSTATAEGKATASPKSVTESTAPESPLATPTSVLATETPTAVLETPVSSSNEIEYAAEKISLAPVNLSVDLPEISAQGAEPPQINFGGWSNSGQMFLFTILPPDYDPTASNSELWVANVDGTGLRKITEYGGLTTWSPDDTQIVSYKQFTVSKQELWVFNLEANRSLKLDHPPGVDIGDNARYDDIAWLDNQSLLYRTYAKTKERRLWLHDIETGHIEEVLVDPTVGEAWRSLQLAPDKVSILGRTDRDYWLGKVVQAEGEPVRLEYVKTLISDKIILAYWSPDSAKLAFRVSGEFDKEHIVQILDLNSEQVTEIPFPHRIARVEWSPDSQAMIVRIFGAGTETPSPIYTVNANGSGLRQLGEFFLGTMQWSPDGQYLGLFLSDDTNKHNPFGIIKIEVSL